MENLKVRCTYLPKSSELQILRYENNTFQRRFHIFLYCLKYFGDYHRAAVGRARVVHGQGGLKVREVHAGRRLDEGLVRDVQQKAHVASGVALDVRGVEAVPAEVL